MRRTASLSTLVYDIPYFGSCGIFPPLHICNQKFKTGGSEGGMSPGACWEPFEISAEEYAELVEVIETLDPSTISGEARYTRVKFEFDPSFDHISDLFQWIHDVCEKHRAGYHRRAFGGDAAT